ncbi:MAG: hypothetical protein QOK04_368 [Solirubrobacteraceae bacterium]|nr:hypothetical protein [Solirubrobacteraceae bacterium]
MRAGVISRRAAAALAGALALAATAPATVGAQGVDQNCVLALSKFDPAAVNVAYPDESAQYYSGAYQAAPGTRIRIAGQYARARYTSFQVYDVLQRPLDGLADLQLGPDPGSSNPFLPGASRTLTQRSYTAFIDFGPIPSTRAPNTIYTGTGQGGLPNFQGTFIYRLYIPDQGRDEFGDAGLPTATLEASSGGPAPPGACSNFSRPSPPGVNEAIAASNGVPVSPGGFEYPGRVPPQWKKFTNLPAAVVQNIFNNQYGDPFYQAFNASGAEQVGGSGGFLSNIHNSYLYATISRTHGQVVIVRFRAPPFADTRPGPPRMPASNMRYWSMCQNQTASQRFIACRPDDRSVKTHDGFVTYAVSVPEQRPANATDGCGVNWLPWGPTSDGTLIYRNMLPERSFPQAIQFAKPTDEVATMGDYFPVSRYYSTADFEQLGCGSALSSALHRQIPPATCRDRAAPLSAITRRLLQRSRNGFSASGTAVDRDCGGRRVSRNRVRSVSVALGRMSGRRCRFLGRSGRFGSRRSCGSPLLNLRASTSYSRRTASTSWHVSRRIALARGSYVLSIAGADTVGNRERPHRVARFSVR